MTRRIILSILTCGLFLAGNHRCRAQATSPRDELLALVRPDAGFCLSVQNLRDETAKWARSPWIKAVRATPLGQTIENGPELRELIRLDGEMQKRMGIDWAKLRDDILGDAVVLAYWPAPPDQPETEKGLLLIRARRADLLKQLVDRFNLAQQKSKELKRLEEKEYQGVKYLLREDQRTVHFLLVADDLLAFTDKEDLLKWIIDRRKGTSAEKNVIAEQVKRAGAERALATLWINPRAFDAELQQRAKDPGSNGQLLKSFLNYWRPLDAIVLSVSDAEDFELRLAIQARAQDLPASVRKAFTEPSKLADLWSRFPEDAILSVAREIDAASLVDCIGDFLTPETRKSVLESLQKTLGTAINLKQVVPNIGPDLGMFVAPGLNAKDSPDILIALAVKPGPGAVKVDRALLTWVNVLASLAVLANSDDLKIQQVLQDNVEVSFMTGSKILPEGMRPAWALKDGYLVLASSPEAVLRFRAPKNAPAAVVGDEVPVLMLSATELAKLLRARREQVISYLTEQNKGLNRDAAGLALESALHAMDLIHQVTFLQGSGNGQLTWTLRVRPRTSN